MSDLLLAVIVLASMSLGFLLGVSCKNGIYIHCNIDESMNKQEGRRG